MTPRPRRRPEPPAVAAAAARAVGRSAELATQASGAACEFVRQRRDPAVVVGRRRRRARRAAVAYGAGGLAALVLGAARVTGGLSAPVVVLILVVLLVTLWCIAGVVRGVRTVRRLDRQLDALPAPAPARPPVDGAVRPAMQQLDGYSDGLRHLVTLIGVSGPSPVAAPIRSGRRSPPPGSAERALVELRRDILTAADATERHLRRRAADLGGVLRARATAPAAARPGLEVTARSLADEIRAGVDGYGRLVTAAGETVAASRTLESSLSPTGPEPGSAALDESAERLRALAAGMHELTRGRPG